MKPNAIPFSPFPPQVVIALGKPFKPIGAMILGTSARLKDEFLQAGLNLKPEEYRAATGFVFVFYFVIGAILVYLLTLKFFPKNAPIAALIGGIALGFLIAFQVAMYPKIAIKKKIRDIERNLVFALRTIMIEIKSGVTLFDALNMVADGEYGELSKEFKKTVGKINTGTMQEAALEEMAENNPSRYLKRSIWQTLDGMRSGVDVTSVFSELVGTMNRELKIQITEYGASLKLLSLMYMMIAVIMPALGLTFLIILSSFPQIKISEMLFWILLIVIVVAEFMFLGIMKAKRPNLLGA